MPTAKKKANKHIWFLIFVSIAGVFLISHRHRQISDNCGITSLVSFLVYRFLMWHVPQIFHRLFVRLSNKFLKIDCHHYTKLIKNMNSMNRWGWVWDEELCRTDRLVLFVSDSQCGSSFWSLGGNKVCEILRIVPLPSDECKLSFSRAHARLLRPKVDKVSQNRCFVFFFHGKALLALDYLYFAMHQEVKERVCE